MVNLYDEALLAKLKRWTEKTDIHIYGPEQTRQMLEVIADTTNDTPIKLPIVCLRRKGGYTILNTNKRVLTYEGLAIKTDDETKTIDKDDENKNLMVLNAIPISIQYQLDIYTRYLKEADAYCRDFIFNIINHPNVQVVIPYNNANFVHNSTIRVSADVEDNSDIQERLVVGQFTRLSLSIDIDDAYLWDTKIRKPIEIGIDSSINDYEEQEAIDEDAANKYAESLEGLNIMVHTTTKDFSVEPLTKVNVNNERGE